MSTSWAGDRRAYAFQPNFIFGQHAEPKDAARPASDNAVHKSKIDC
jgi:hypothetical protein